MGAQLYNKFSPGFALRLIKASWLNKVANLWNYARGGRCINFTIPDNPGPENGPIVDLDLNMLDGELELRGFLKEDTVGGKVTYSTLPGDDAAPEDWNNDDGTGYGDAQTRAKSGGGTETYYTACGTSKRSAPINHRHKSNLAPLGQNEDDGLDTYGGQRLAEWVSDGADGLKSNGTTGESKFAARADHTHPGVDAGDVPYTTDQTVEDKLDEICDVSTSGFLKNENGTVSVPDDQPIALDSDSTGLVYNNGGTVLYKSIGDGSEYDVASGNHTHSEYLTEDDLGDLGDLYAAKNHTHTAAQISTSLSTAAAPVSVQDELDDLGDIIDSITVTETTGTGDAATTTYKIPLTSLTGNIDGHTGNCFVTIDNDGALGHSGNTAYNLLTNAAYTNGETRNANKLITDLDIGNGLEADSQTFNIRVKAKPNGGINVDSDGVSLGGLTGTGFVKNENGEFSIPEAQPITVSGTGIVKVADGAASANETIGTAEVDGLADWMDVVDEQMDLLGSASTCDADDFAASNHDHDGVYSKLNHTHSNYAASDHNHSGTYAEKSHKHSTEDITSFADGVKGVLPTCFTKTPSAYTGSSGLNVMFYLSGTIGYGTLSDIYALKSHTHSGYAASNHTHSNYATTNHTHSNYATTNHTHSDYATASALETLTGIVDGIVEDYVTSDTLSTELSSYSTTETSNGAYAAKSYESAVDELNSWADVVDEQMDLLGSASTCDADDFAASNHDHDGVYSKLNHTHSNYAASDHNHSGTYAEKSHKHSTEDITSFADGVKGVLPTCFTKTPSAYTGSSGLNVMFYLSGTIGYGTLSDIYALKSHTHSGYAASNHTHSNYATTNHTHSNYATTNHTHSDYATASALETLTGIVDGIVEDYVTSDTLSTELSSYSTTETSNGAYAAKSYESAVDELNSWADVVDAELDDMATLTSTAPSDIGMDSNVGTATDAARADHVHKLADPATGASVTDLGGGVGSSVGSATSTASSSAGTVGTGTGKISSGFKFLVAGAFDYGGDQSKIWFREITVGKDGRIVSVSQCNKAGQLFDTVAI